MSKELREKLVKMAKVHSEKTKIGVRKARQKGMAEVKKKGDVSKDSIRRLEKHVCCNVWFGVCVYLDIMCHCHVACMHAGISCSLFSAMCNMYYYQTGVPSHLNCTQQYRTVLCCSRNVVPF